MSKVQVLDREQPYGPATADAHSTNKQIRTDSLRCLFDLSDIKILVVDDDTIDTQESSAGAASVTAVSLHQPRH